MRLPKFKYITQYYQSHRLNSRPVGKKFLVYRLGKLYKYAIEKKKYGIYYVLHYDNRWYKFLYAEYTGWSFIEIVKYEYEDGLCVDRDRDLNLFGLVPSLPEKEWEAIRNNPNASKYWKDMAQANVYFHYQRSQRLNIYKLNKKIK